MFDNKYEFKIGDEVIDVDGDHGRIIDICTCDQCKERGFYEPIWQSDVTDSEMYISNFEAEHGFPSYYQIGKYKFGELDRESVIDSINYFKEQLARCERQLKFIEAIENGQNPWSKD